MSRVSQDPRLPILGSIDYEKNLSFQLTRILREIAQQLNSLSEGRVFATYNANTAAPTTGDYFQGDYVKNSEPAEAGSGGSKYVILGWVCVASGTPGTWNECRVLTGN